MTLRESCYMTKYGLKDLSLRIGHANIGGKTNEEIIDALDNYSPDVIDLIRSENTTAKTRNTIEESYLRGRLKTYRLLDEGTNIMTIPEIVFNKGYLPPDIFYSQTVKTSFKGAWSPVIFSTPVYRDAFDIFAQQNKVTQIESLLLSGLRDRTSSQRYQTLITLAYYAGLSSQWLEAKKLLPKAQAFQRSDAKRRNADHWDM